MKLRLVQAIENELIVTEFPDADKAVPAMEIRGFTFTGINRNDYHRAELQGAPKFAQLCGPMWDGDAIRYEDVAANDILCR